MSNFDNNDYVDVAQRIREFRDKHPEGSLQPLNHGKPYDIFEIEGQTYIAYVACAYRTPDDPTPGIGCAYEMVPGKTNFTRGSELQNAETSAWGRAIVAALAADTKKIASREEVENRQAEQTQEVWDNLEPSVLNPSAIDKLAPRALGQELRARKLDDGGTIQQMRDRLRQTLTGAAVQEDDMTVPALAIGDGV